jgi:predicted deacylase
MAVHCNIEDFNPDALPGASKQAVFLEFCGPGSGESLGIPVLMAKGRNPGQTLVVVAGVHGDELEGVQAVHQVFHGLNVEEMSGNVIAVPVANLPAYRAGRRTSPIDSLNLARTFPGRRDGTVTERIAFHLSEAIIPHADFFIDLHSAGLTYRLPRMVGYDACDTKQGRVSKDAALHFGMPVMWGHASISPGRSLCEAVRRGIPWLYVESPSGGRVAQSELPHYICGLLNLLKYLKIIPGVVEPQRPQIHLLGSGDLDRTMVVNSSGFFVPLVNLLDVVRPDQVVGIVRDLFGETIEEVRTPQGGCVGMLRAMPLVTPGDAVCLMVEKE